MHRVADPPSPRARAALKAAAFMLILAACAQTPDPVARNTLSGAGLPASAVASSGARLTSLIEKPCALIT